MRVFEVSLSYEMIKEEGKEERKEKKIWKKI
jgi:hypothetical protein